MYHTMEDSIHCTHHLFMETGIILWEWERKLEKVQKKNLGKRIAVRKKNQPIQRNSNSGRHFINKAFVNKALSNFDLEGWIDKLGIKHFRSIFSRDALPENINKKECGKINLDDIEGSGTHWVCYRNLEKNLVEYFDPFGLIMPYEIPDYLFTSGKKKLFSRRNTK